MSEEISRVETEVGGAIGSTVFRPEADRGVLFLHGYLSSQAGYHEYAEAVTAQTAATCMTIDLFGHGISNNYRPDSYTFNEHLDQVVDAYDSLTKGQGVNPERVGVVGASYGGYLAVMLSALRPIKSLLLRAPAHYPDGLEDKVRTDIDADEVDTYRLSLDPTRIESRNLTAAASFAGRAVIVQSEKDESIPETVIQAYDHAFPDSSIHVIRDAKHSLEGDKRQVFKKIVVDWAKKL